MKRCSLICTTIIFCLSICSVQAEQSVSIEAVIGAWNHDTLIIDNNTVLDIRVTNTPGNGCVYNAGFNWHLFSPDGATWEPRFRIDTTEIPFPPPPRIEVDTVNYLDHHPLSFSPMFFHRLFLDIKVNYLTGVTMPTLSL